MLCWSSDGTFVCSAPISASFSVRKCEERASLTHSSGLGIDKSRTAPAKARGNPAKLASFESELSTSGHQGSGAERHDYPGQVIMRGLYCCHLARWCYGRDQVAVLSS